MAEDLPELYREILDRVADLERIGARSEAARIRADATRVYSNSWDENARKVLTSLRARADRSATSTTGTRSWTLRRRSVATR